MKLFRRIFLLLAGLFVIAYGTALSVRSDLGITPISCPPYVFAVAFPQLTMGQHLIVMHISFILLQWILLRRQFQPRQWLQVLLAFCFGYFVDFCLYLTSSLVPASYAMQMVLALLGVVVTAIGVVMEVRADIIYLAGDGLMMAVSQVLHRDYDRVKIFFDAALVIVSALSSWLFIGTIVGIREGTLINALGVGPVMILINRILNKRRSR